MTLNQSTLNPLSSSTTSETLLSISVQPDFTDHSFEVLFCYLLISTFSDFSTVISLLIKELRVAYLQAGRELNSREIFSANATPVATQLPRPLSMFMDSGVSGVGGSFAHAPPVRPF